jgi:cytochrome c oxidase subunit 2
MSTSPPATEADRNENRHHGRRVAVIWFVLSVIATPLMFFWWGPHLPPGRMTTSAIGAQWSTQVLATIATPVMIFVWTMIIYSMRVFRQRGAVIEDGPPIRGNMLVQTSWITVTAAIVLFLAAFGTYELVTPAGAGAGEGPNPIWTPKGHNVLQVQVIGQQWRWTYRYPQFGGMESTVLMLPVDTPIQFNVTSLDVIHSFWAYKLGVKADANPGVNNVAFTTALQTGTFIVRCNELCGLWHADMFNNGAVMTTAAFDSWASTYEAAHAATTKILPPYALTYTPDDLGADGGDYNLTEDPIAPPKKS